MKNKFNRFTSNHPLVFGTLLLTGTGFLSRIIGFFYRIYLSRLFGEECMGIYQLITPVISLAFSLTAAAFQTSISKFVAADIKNADHSHRNTYKPLIMGLSVSIPLAMILALILFFGSDLIAASYLQEPRTGILIKLLSFTLPISAAHACINGYYYGIRIIYTRI